MFNGVPEQFHQFIASRASPSPLPPLSASFPFHGFDPLPNPNPSPPPPLHHQQHHFLHHPSMLLHHNDVQQAEQAGKDQPSVAMPVSFSIDARAEDQPLQDHSPWSNEEVVALLRIGSSMENWFPEFTWEHVSRKLAELGFKRSAVKCKEKFEEQTRTFNSSSSNNIDINLNYSKNNNYRLLVNELEEFYDHQLPHNLTPTPTPTPPQQQQLREVSHNDINNSGGGIIEKSMEEEDKEAVEGEEMGQNNMEEVDSRAVEMASLDGDRKRLLVEEEEEEEEEDEEDKVAKKRKRQERFEMFKSFCEDVVEKLMAQQEDMHNKLLEDMIRRDREMVDKEEARKKMEMERINKELDIRAQEQTVARDRQAAIIELLKRFTSPPWEGHGDGHDPSPNPNPGMPSATAGPVDEDDQPNPSPPLPPPPPPPRPATISPNPRYSRTPQNPSNAEGSDTGKRWPREEVLALINLRCTIQGNNSELDRDQQPQGATKAPLWERISQGMSELGYKRSAKRCKEKWENINKYFRKTKDSNSSKKRSLDSRTCPYFQQLSALYDQGKPAAAVPPPENRPCSPDSCPASQSQETQ